MTIFHNNATGCILYILPCCLLITVIYFDILLKENIYEPQIKQIYKLFI